jgi:2-polyprenyl-3-methyl-5-hydroxy-6-metoxy-1,4-benzoquinol methylase
MSGTSGQALRRAADPKSGGYYANVRSDLLSMLPRPLGRVLDVGCGEAAGATALREAGATHITGVEPYADAAAVAGRRYDDVERDTIENALGRLKGQFDTILLHDVLEHLIDPASVLTGLGELAAPGARAQVSVPNARYFGLVYDLVVRGTFGYSEWGHRDSTHLRWFTPADIRALLEATGWMVQSDSHQPLGRTRLLDRATGGRVAQFLVVQWYVLAVRGR